MIIDAALRLSDAETGLERLTVRRLAAELGVGTMTLYGYFRSKEEILDSIADHVLGEMRLPEADDDDPATALRTVGWAFLNMMREHPSVVQLFATRVTQSPESMRGAMEGVLERLVSSGIPGTLAVRCYSFLISYAMGFAAYQAPRTWARTDTENRAELRRQRQHFYSALSKEDFPQLVELAPHLVDLPSDEQFSFGLEALIARVLSELDG
ncbi:AcrR family transcriptional regulator [Spinactinospora alkalitolerans]|uniref:AcrR family transcriptional regulator n=1 Tax=Spinactinospora alkalitolerans TaxID=687207 RepID=A0A852TT93_9ACTN|nr:TetR/AcrR family transcriptional regulator [Spinactinospora alkalitolerans]NYE47148.1 AcrR family transcriptional regulator [Spinactinospora alkalitolerans]